MAYSAIEYIDFVKAVDTMLVCFKQDPTGPLDMNTLIHSFGYGHSVQLTFENVVYNRRIK